MEEIDQIIRIENADIKIDAISRKIDYKDFPAEKLLEFYKNSILLRGQGSGMVISILEDLTKRIRKLEGWRD